MIIFVVFMYWRSCCEVACVFFPSSALLLSLLFRWQLLSQFFRQNLWRWFRYGVMRLNGCFGFLLFLGEWGGGRKRDCLDWIWFIDDVADFGVDCNSSWNYVNLVKCGWNRLGGDFIFGKKKSRIHLFEKNRWNDVTWKKYWKGISIP